MSKQNFLATWAVLINSFFSDRDDISFVDQIFCIWTARWQGGHLESRRNPDTVHSWLYDAISALAYEDFTCEILGFSRLHVLPAGGSNL